MSGEKVPPDADIVASASRTGSAEAQTGGTAVSGTVINSAFSSQTIGHQSNHWYSVFARQEKRASGWGGLTALVLLVTVVVLYMRPEGPESQFVISYVLLATANVVSVLLAVDAWTRAGESRSVRLWPGRTGGIPVGARLLLSSLCLILAALALLQMDHVRKYGRVDVAADEIDISPRGPLENLEQTVLTVRPAAERRYLGLVMTISSSSPGACLTTFSLAVGEQPPEKEHEKLKGGDLVKLDLEKGRPEIKLRLTVATAADCEVNIGVAQASVYS
ncbi:hypothetical protein [Streptomyces sp. NPDC018000]|uniref:hypothetical protein n=1 Tax=Streptomyces sp. NPDC018000 TaxID=3365028 RepID=UPI0037934DE0